MVMVIARMRVAEGKLETFRRIMADLAAEVRAHEPGCKLYQLCAGKQAGQFVMVERYVDQDALTAHAQSPHFKAAFPKLGDVLAERPEIEVFTEV